MNATHTEQLTDVNLISIILKGQREAYALIVHRYNAYLYRIGRTYGYSHADTEDLMQDTYLQAYLNLKNFENRAAFKTWLTRIMLNACYHRRHAAKYLKEDYQSTPLVMEEKSRPMFTDHHTDTDQKVANNELTRYLELALLQLPEGYRIVFTLRALNGFSTKETAIALNLTETNVKVKFLRAKTMLQKELLKVYQPEEIFEFNLIYCSVMVERVMVQINEMEGPIECLLSLPSKG